MKHILQGLKININEKVYVKDPETTELGKRIVEKGILLIDEIGFEHFTFRKLGTEIKSNESSIYRYFENKHKFLVYLSCWYWGWKEYQLVLSTNSIADASEKLLKAVEVATQIVEQDEAFSHINEVALNKIIINESSKSYLTKEVDADNQDGFFEVYKRLVKRIAEMIQEVSAEYQFPLSLSSMILDGALHQHFLKDHINSITDCSESVSASNYFQDLVINTLKMNNNG